MLIRPARPADAPALAAIYNHAVENGTAIWNEVLVDTANRRDWMAQRQARGFPVLVAEAGGGAAGAADGAPIVAGYASYGDFRAFDGYRATVEHSVYVRHDQRGLGLGRALLAALIEQAREQGLHVMVGAIESGNQASIALHRALGFQISGQMPGVGQKFGRWLDLTWVQIQLDDRPHP